MDTINIFYIVLLVCASALCIALIFYLNRITKSVNTIENEVKNLSDQTKPLLVSVNSLSSKLNDIVEEAKEQVEVVKDIISEVKEHTEKILELEEKVRRGVEGPVTDVFKNLSAIGNGINTFWNTYKGKHHT